jgi:N-acetylmuramoyl-L-alanine amidase
MKLPTLIERPSPNHDERPAGQSIDILLLHYTGMRSAEAALERLCDPAARVSAHYAIDEEGSCYRLVREERRAWHAGVSSWAGRTDINACSIGIELVNPGHEFGYRPFPEPQMARLEQLCQAILARRPIPSHRVLGHSDVAPQRKQDPGELFDWPRLARAGIGIWPKRTWATPGPLPLQPGDSGTEVTRFRGELSAFGYGIAPEGSYDNAAIAVVTAFQRHFRRGQIDGIADPETRTLLQSLLGSLPRS